jgi:hypothetical protein
VLVRILFEVSGDRQLDRDILRVGDRARDMSPAFERVADPWIEETAVQFATEGRHASGGWKPLKDSTVAAKRREHLRPEILRAHDRLMRSLTSPTQTDPNMILKIRPGELDYGSKLPYAGAHQNPKPGNPLPRRRPVEFTEKTRRDTIKILQRYLITGEVA